MTVNAQLRQDLLGGGWTPNNLFGPTDTGDWWNVANGNRIWTTSAASVLAGDGVGVGRIDGLKNGNNLTQGTSSKKPVLHFDGSQRYLTYDGVDDYLNGAFTLAQPFTRVMAVQANTYVSGGARIFDGSTGAASLFQFGTSPAISMYAGGTVAPSSTQLTLSVSHVTTEIFNGASSKLAVDNNSAATGNPGTASSGGLIVGAITAGASQFSNINWYGGIAIGRVLTDAEIGKCRTYFGRLASLSL